MKQKDLSRTVSNKNAGTPKVHVMPWVGLKRPVDDTRDTASSKQAADGPPAKSSKRGDPPTTQSLLISVKTVAAMLSVSNRQIWRLRDAGEIPQPIKLGKSVRWRIDEIKAWIEHGCPQMQQKRRKA